MKFGRGLEPPPRVETALRIEEAGADRGAVFGSIVARGFGLPDLAADWFAALPERPGFRLFLAYDGDEPAGAGALFVRDGIGWLGVAATLPEHRRKGAQGAILAARIRLARELGLRALATETGERTADRPSNSYRNILRAGFDELYLRPNYVSPVCRFTARRFRPGGRGRRDSPPDPARRSRRGRRACLPPGAGLAAPRRDS